MLFRSYFLIVEWTHECGENWFLFGEDAGHQQLVQSPGLKSRLDANGCRLQFSILHLFPEHRLIEQAAA